MTDQRWNKFTDPEQMIIYLARENLADERKLRLFAVACCRLMGDMPNEEYREILDIAERFANGTVGIETLEQARSQAWGTWWDIGGDDPPKRFMINHASAPISFTRVNAQRMVRRGLHNQSPDGQATISQQYVHLLHDIFGPTPKNPPDLQPFVKINPVIAEMARSMEADRDFSAMPFLADALEEAGCVDEALLAHCRRTDRPHALGDWVLDAVLGRKIAHSTTDRGNGGRSM